MDDKILDVMLSMMVLSAVELTPLDGSVCEGMGSVLACVELTGELDVTINATLATQDVTAQGKACSTVYTV